MMYRADIIDEPHMPDAPTWDEVAEIAREIDSDEMAGICLRGKPGWGDLGAAFTTVLNTFGGTWWAANDDGSIGASQVDQPEFAEALNFYVDLLNDAGEDDAANSSFNECKTLYEEGKVAMWYDATVAASLFPEDVVGPTRLRSGSDQGDRRIRLAVGVDPRHPGQHHRPGRRMGVRRLGNQRWLPRARSPPKTVGVQFLRAPVSRSTSAPSTRKLLGPSLSAPSTPCSPLRSTTPAPRRGPVCPVCSTSVFPSSRTSAPAAPSCSRQRSPAR